MQPVAPYSPKGVASYIQRNRNAQCMPDLYRVSQRIGIHTDGNDFTGDLIHPQLSMDLKDRSDCYQQSLKDIRDTVSIDCFLKNNFNLNNHITTGDGNGSRR